MNFGNLLAGVAVVLAVEGLLYAAFPNAMRRAIAAIAAQPDGRLRAGGLAAAAGGTAVAWILTAA
ncbi:MAG TPA: DUF2065 family protein [Acetobacteraceae bacterium]|nr:DUF2065 family protein [Acetobacteraceae bacterium]